MEKILLIKHKYTSNKLCSKLTKKNPRNKMREIKKLFDYFPNVYLFKYLLPDLIEAKVKKINYIFF